MAVIASQANGVIDFFFIFIFFNFICKKMNNSRAIRHYFRSNQQFTITFQDTRLLFRDENLWAKRDFEEKFAQ